MDLSRFFLALGIPQVGRKTAKTLAEYVTSMIEMNRSVDIENPSCEEDISHNLLKNALTSLSAESLIDVHDIGPVSAEAIVDYFSDNSEPVERLLQEVQPKMTFK